MLPLTHRHLAHTWQTHTQEHWRLALRCKETNARTVAGVVRLTTNQLELVGGRHLGEGDSGQAPTFPLLHPEGAQTLYFARDWFGLEIVRSVTPPRAAGNEAPVSHWRNTM